MNKPPYHFIEREKEKMEEDKPKSERIELAKKIWVNQSK